MIRVLIHAHGIFHVPFALDSSSKSMAGGHASVPFPAGHAGTGRSKRTLGCFGPRHSAQWICGLKGLNRMLFNILNGLVVMATLKILYSKTSMLRNETW